MRIIYILNLNIIASLPNRKNPQDMNHSEKELKIFSSVREKKIEKMKRFLKT